MVARRLLRQQVTKGINHAIGRINRTIEAKIRHLGLKCLRVESAARKSLPKVGQCSLADVKSRHLIAAGGELRNESATAAGWLQKPVRLETAIPPTCSLDEIGLQISAGLEANIVVLRIIVPICLQNAASWHAYLSLSGAIACLLIG